VEALNGTLRAAKCQKKVCIFLIIFLIKRPLFNFSFIVMGLRLLSMTAYTIFYSKSLLTSSSSPLSSLQHIWCYGWQRLTWRWRGRENLLMFFYKIVFNLSLWFFSTAKEKVYYGPGKNFSASHSRSPASDLIANTGRFSQITRKWLASVQHRSLDFIFKY
jgi:hypothetical protein